MFIKIKSTMKINLSCSHYLVSYQEIDGDGSVDYQSHQGHLSGLFFSFAHLSRKGHLISECICPLSSSTQGHLSRTELDWLLTARPNDS